MINVDRMNSYIGYASNCYVLESDGEYAIVDPSVRYDVFSSRFGDLSDRIKYIIVTHAHFDHMLEVCDWTSRLGLPVTVGAADATALSDPDRNCYRFFMGTDDGYNGPYVAVNHGDKLTLGAREIEVISTPGHTPGGISLFLGQALIVGDTVFSDGGYGRSDLPGGCMEALFSSISYLTGRFDNDITVFSGHGRSTSIGEIKMYF